MYFANSDTVQVSATRPTRIMVSVTFLAVGVNTFPKYDSHYHDCHDNFNIFVKTILTKKLWFVKPEISLSAHCDMKGQKLPLVLDEIGICILDLH